MKQALYKSIGHGNLCWKELEQVSLIRGARLIAGKSHIEHPRQHLFPMEMSCDRNPTKDLGPRASQRKSSERQTRDASGTSRKLSVFSKLTSVLLKLSGK